MWRVRRPLGDHGLDFGHSLGQLWVRWSGLGFCGMSISRFWLNLVHEVGWFGFLETHEAWIFLYGPINSKEAWNYFCMLLVRGILTKSRFLCLGGQTWLMWANP